MYYMIILFTHSFCGPVGYGRCFKKKGSKNLLHHF